jgi:hypothetical protein
MTRAKRAEHWRTIMEKQTVSGMSAAAFCRENHIRISQFYWWRRRFRKGNSQGNESRFLQLVPISKSAQHGGIRIRLRDGLSIEVDPGFDPHTLRGVIETIGGGETNLCSR